MAASSVLLANSVQEMGKLINVSYMYNVTGLIWLVWHVKNRGNPSKTVDPKISEWQTHSSICVSYCLMPNHTFLVHFGSISDEFGWTTVCVLVRGIAGYQDSGHSLWLANCEFGYGTEASHATRMSTYWSCHILSCFTFFSWQRRHGHCTCMR